MIAGDNGREYSMCVDPCTTTCQSHGQEARECAANAACVPGCACPAGSIWDELQKQCVEEGSCTCYDPFTESVVPAGEAPKRGCNDCTCANGQVTCTEEECAESICPGNQEWRSDVSPCKQTCANYEFVDPADCPQPVRQGCGCAPGLVLDGVDCIPADTCPCVYGGKAYATGATVQKDCNTCTCKGKYWECEQEACDATCVAYGDPHYVTFDGTRYSFEGACEYVLAKHSDGAESKFSVRVENVPCGSTGTTCAKAVNVRVTEGLVDKTFKIVRGAGVNVCDRDGNCARAQLPLDVGDGTVRVYRAGEFIMLVTKFGMRVAVDQGTRVALTVGPAMKHLLTGLCGLYNGQSDDDLTTEAGALESDPYVFASSFRYDTTCEDMEKPESACDRHKYRRQWAQKSCAVINRAQKFARCRAGLGQDVVETYYEWCLEDACSCDSGGDCECMCTAVGAFADECARKGYPVRWRSHDLCRAPPSVPRSHAMRQRHGLQGLRQRLSRDLQRARPAPARFLHRAVRRGLLLPRRPGLQRADADLHAHARLPLSARGQVLPAGQLHEEVVSGLVRFLTVHSCDKRECR